MRIPTSLLAAGITAAGVFAFGGPVLAQGMGMGPNLENMFLDEDTDDFDPGLPIGARFPEIRALYQGREINDVDEFFGERGLAFFAVRSADW